MSRDILLVKSGGADAIPEWRALFRAALPDLEVHWWDDPSIDPAAVTYVLVWQPQPGRLARFPNLKAIFSSGSGVDHIVHDPALPRHVPVIRMTADQTAQTMGEYVCLHTLAWLRDLQRMLRAQAECRWDEFEAPRLAPNTRVGIMGLGTIGQHCAGMLLALGFQVHGWARGPKEVRGVPCRWGEEGLAAFLAESDVLVGLLPDTPHTRGLLCARTLRLLPKGALVINIARGPLAVLEDLLALLDDGHLSAAVLDVFDPEPLAPAHPAWRHPKVTVTGHIAGFASRSARAEKVVEAIACFRQGGRPDAIFDPVRGY